MNKKITNLAIEIRRLASLRFKCPENEFFWHLCISEAYQFLEENPEGDLDLFWDNEPKNKNPLLLTYNNPLLLTHKQHSTANQEIDDLLSKLDNIDDLPEIVDIEPTQNQEIDLLTDTDLILVPYNNYHEIPQYLKDSFLNILNQDFDNSQMLEKDIELNQCLINVEKCLLEVKKPPYDIWKNVHIVDIESFHNCFILGVMNVYTQEYVQYNLPDALDRFEDFLQNPDEYWVMHNGLYDFGVLITLRNHQKIFNLDYEGWQQQLKTPFLNIINEKNGEPEINIPLEMYFKSEGTRFKLQTGLGYIAKLTKSAALKVQYIFEQCDPMEIGVIGKALSRCFEAASQNEDSKYIGSPAGYRVSLKHFGMMNGTYFDDGNDFSKKLKFKYEFHATKIYNYVDLINTLLMFFQSTTYILMNQRFDTLSQSGFELTMLSAISSLPFVNTMWKPKKTTYKPLNNFKLPYFGHNFYKHDGIETLINRFSTKQKVPVKTTLWTCGLGGVHYLHHDYSTWRSNKDNVIVDIDFESFYPNLMVKYLANILKFYQTDDFTIDQLIQLIFDRVRLKKTNPDAAKSAKTKINAIFGLLGIPSASIYVPNGKYAVTLLGQQLLIHLYEQVSEFGTLIQANTDGLTMRISRGSLDMLKQRVDEVEKSVGIKIEVSLFDFLYFKDISNYFGVGNDGTQKEKGCFDTKLKWYTQYPKPLIEGFKKALINGIKIDNLSQHLSDSLFIEDLKYAGNFPNAVQNIQGKKYKYTKKSTNVELSTICQNVDITKQRIIDEFLSTMIDFNTGLEWLDYRNLWILEGLKRLVTKTRYPLLISEINTGRILLQEELLIKPIGKFNVNISLNGTKFEFMTYNGVDYIIKVDEPNPIRQTKSFENIDLDDLGCLKIISTKKEMKQMSFF